MKNNRLTNKRIIAELMPILLKRAIAKRQNVTLDEKDFYNHPCHIEYEHGIKIKWSKFAHGEEIISVTKPLTGKFDHATISATFREGIVSFRYEKEFTGMGNGYYADLDANGKFIRAEWD